MNTLLTIDPMMIAFIFLFAFCLGALIFGQWKEIGYSYRRIVKALKRFWRHQQGGVLSVPLLLAVIRITPYKHGGWLITTALLSLACGLAIR